MKLLTLLLLASCGGAVEIDVSDTDQLSYCWARVCPTADHVETGSWYGEPACRCECTDGGSIVFEAPSWPVSDLNAQILRSKWLGVCPG